MLSPSEGKEIYERVMADLEAGQEMTPEDVAALMQAAESGYAPAQNAYGNVLNNIEGNLLAALPWFCKAVQQGDREAQNTLRELYAAESLVREHVSHYLSVQELIELRKRRVEESSGTSSQQGFISAPIALAVGAVTWLCVEDDTIGFLCIVGGILLGALVEFLWKHFR